MSYLVIGARCLLGVIFLVSVVGKIAGGKSYQAYMDSVRDLRVPAPLVGLTAFTVVCAEFAVCVVLAVPAPTANTAGLTVAAALLTAFALGIARALRQNVRVPCRCFGASTTPLGPGHVVRNLTFAAVALLGAFGAQLAGPGPAQVGGTALALFSGLVLAGLFITFDDLVGLFRSGLAPAAPSRQPHRKHSSTSLIEGRPPWLS